MIMKFKVIDKNTDYIINKEYYLCKVNLADLITFVKEKLGDIDFDQFNQRFTKFDIDEYYEIDNEPEKNKRIRETRIYDMWNETKEIRLEREENDKYYDERHNYFFNKERKLKSESNQKFIYENSTENNFISLYSEYFDGKKFDGKFYLLDGYRRLLFNFNLFERNTNKDVYVKIYTNTTTDQDIMKLMFNFNMWKIPQGVDEWFDRGWRLFIYMRLGIEFTQQHFYHLDRYVGDYYIKYRDYSEQETIITSSQFYNDLKAIDYLINCEKMHHDKGKHFNYQFIEKLATIRKNGNVNELNIEDWIYFLDLKYQDVDKIKSMGVHGHYVKRIDSLVNDFFKIWENPKLIEEMKNKKPKGTTKTTIEDFYWKIPDYFRNEIQINVVNDNEFIIDNEFYEYENNKIYQPMEGFYDVKRVRVFLFFDKYHIIYFDKIYYIINNSFSPDANMVMHRDQEKNIIAFGTKDEMISKVKELTKKDWNPNTRRTDFL